jgi:hypothetical protein
VLELPELEDLGKILERSQLEWSFDQASGEEVESFNAILLNTGRRRLTWNRTRKDCRPLCA